MSGVASEKGIAKDLFGFFFNDFITVSINLSI